VLVRGLICGELDEIMRFASTADATEVAAALELFIDKVLTVVRARNDFEEKYEVVEFNFCSFDQFV